MRKKCVFLKYFEGWASKDVCFVSVFVVILIASIVSRPSGFWKNFMRRDHMCKEIWLVTFIYAGMRRLGVYTKVKPGQHLFLSLSRRQGRI